MNLSSSTQRIQVPLTPTCQIRVTPGKKVTAGSSLAVAAGTVRRLRLPAPIQGSPNFRKKVGEPVRAGETIVVSESHFGLGLVEYLSPLNGVVEALEERHLLIRSFQEPVVAHFDAMVAGVEEAKCIHLTAQGDLIQGFAGSGPGVFGPLYLAGSLYHPTELRRKLTPCLQGAIVAASTAVSGAALELMMECGVQGLIVPSLSWAEWSQVQSGPLSIVITEALGTPTVPQPTWAIMEKHHRRDVYLGGQIPEIFLPEGGRERDGKEEIPVLFRVLMGPLAGQPVRLNPSPGRWIQLPSGQEEWALLVEGIGEETEWVPMCNLERICGCPDRRLMEPGQKKEIANSGRRLHHDQHSTHPEGG